MDKMIGIQVGWYSKYGSQFHNVAFEGHVMVETHRKQLFKLQNGTYLVHKKTEVHGKTLKTIENLGTIDEVALKHGELYTAWRNSMPLTLHEGCEMSQTLLEEHNVQES